MLCLSCQGAPAWSLYPRSVVEIPMRIHLLSDLHLEFGPYVPVAVEADVVVLAGDIHTLGRSVGWARRNFAGRVLIVPGNHEYYGGHLHRTLNQMRAASDDRVTVLDRQSVVIGGVRFVCATGWAELRSTGSYMEAWMAARERMNDYVAIRCQLRGREFARLTPEYAAAASVHARQWLEMALAEPFDGPTVVVTHHAPSLRSLPPDRLPHPLDASYANDWEHLFGPAVALWLHGHTHHPVDYTVNGTRVVSNPHGYPDAIPDAFDPTMVLEVNVPVEQLAG